MAIAFSLLVALAGLLLYGFSTNGKLAEVGRIMFAFGLLAFLLRGVEPLIQLITR